MSQGSGFGGLRIAAGRACAVVALAAALTVSTPGVSGPGDLLWDDVVDKVAGEEDRANAVAVKGKRVFVVGQTTGENNQQDWLTRAYDAKTGNLLWEDQFDFAGQDDEANSVFALGKRVFVCGRVDTDTVTGTDWLVRAYDGKTGNFLWQDQADHREGFDEAVTLGGKGSRLVVGGRANNAFSENSGRDWLIRGYKAKDGTMMWERLFDGGGEGSDELEESGPIPIAKKWFAVVGSARNEQGNRDWTVRVYEVKTGNFAWQDRVDDAGNNDEADVVRTNGKSFFVGGPVHNGNDEDWLVRAYRAKTGEMLWEDRVDNNGRTDDVDAMAVIGKLVIVGGDTRDDANDRDGVIRALNAKTGALVWDDTFDAFAPMDLSDDIDNATAGGGLVFFVGEPRSENNGTDVMVRAYKAKTGEFAWQDLFDGDGEDDDVEKASSVAFKGGRVFVALRSDANAGSTDWIVRAYDAK